DGHDLPERVDEVAPCGGGCVLVVTEPHDPIATPGTERDDAGVENLAQLDQPAKMLDAGAARREVGVDHVERAVDRAQLQVPRAEMLADLVAQLLAQEASDGVESTHERGHDVDLLGHRRADMELN